MAITKQWELAEALRLAKVVEELVETDINAGNVGVSTTYGRHEKGYQTLMDFIAADVQSRFHELRMRAIDEARTRYEAAMQALEDGE